MNMPSSFANAGTRRLALGTVQFGVPYGIANTQGQVPLAMARDMVEFAKARGVDTLDTAIGYGESEQALGQVGVRDFKVVSKLLPVPADLSEPRQWVMREIEASLARLKIDRLHGLLMHRSLDLTTEHGQAIFDAMCELRQAGKVGKIGVSIYSPTELDVLADRFEFDLVQAPFNLVDRRLEGSGWLKRLKEQGCEVHIRSAFLQGLLLMPRTDIPTKFQPWNALWDGWHAWLAQYGEDAVHVCLAYPLSLPEIDRVIVGALDLTQLQQIATAAGRAAKQPFPDLTCDEENLINPAKWPGLQAP